jgi:quercetin dioxygenase-like cupin family protein
MVEIDYSALPKQKAYRINVNEAPTIDESGDMDEEDEGAATIRTPILTNDNIITWTTGQPGDVIPWHTHSPEMYQILINTEGRCVWHYKDNDGNTQSVKGAPGDLIYLPAGAENKVEVVGDGPHTHIGVLRRPRVPRIEQLVGQTDGVYDHREFPAAFVYDDMNDRVVRMDENAVSE